MRVDVCGLDVYRYYICMGVDVCGLIVYGGGCGWGRVDSYGCLWVGCVWGWKFMEIVVYWGRCVWCGCV